jgi:hypothetical protein
LRLDAHQPGTLVALVDYLYERSGGAIGSLSQLISGAVLAIDDETEQITPELLDLIPLDHAATNTRPARRCKPGGRCWFPGSRSRHDRHTARSRLLPRAARRPTRAAPMSGADLTRANLTGATGSNADSAFGRPWACASPSCCSSARLSLSL